MGKSEEETVVQRRMRSPELVAADSTERLVEPRL